ncbi:YceI family protein [Gilvimarinus sp. DA14]|uniref:YceI family protein n=1 Tax=Gilvimarinus sp. DA14 TaxID=2956798 RepID=UPI0020B7B3D3|nr:YceI family protein [Gilvimarinus sp. DA14]UTF60607.1 YceI family protein [Gilvimarinus sp. DA14]
MRAVKTISTLAFLSLTSLPALAHWSLAPEQSSLHFVTVKNDVIAETNQFENFSASVTDEGKIEVSIDLASVNTLIELRDQRLRDILFTTEQFPQATLSAELGADYLQELSLNKPQNLDVELEINLHGQTKALPAHLTVTKLDDETLLVATRAPVLVNAKDFALLEGIQQLQTIAGLNSIESVVPVTGVWTFKLGH